MAKNKIHIPVREGMPPSCIVCGKELHPKSEFYCSPCCYDTYSISDSKDHPPFLSKWKIRKKKEAQDPLIRVRKKTRAKTNDLLKQGCLKKSPCVVCLSPNVLPHHEDYADPFNVIWLCEQHHTAYHDQKITLFNGKLQWNIEKLIPKGFQGSFPKKKYRTKGTDRLDGYIASPSNLTIKRGCAKSVQPA